MLLTRLSNTVTTVLCVNTSLRKEEEIIKVHILNMEHMSTNELERKLKKKEEVELIRLLNEE